MKTFIKQVTTISLILILLIFSAVPTWAIDIPTAPTAPESPSIESSINSPEPPLAPETPLAPTPEEITDGTQNEENTSQTEENQSNQAGGGDTGISGATGTIETGNATTSGAITNIGNDNLSANNSTQDIQATNTDNGAGSENNIGVQTEDNNLTVQENIAEVDNGLEMETKTGDNSTSYNTGEDSSVITGDANTTGTIITSINTNVDAVSVSEFNIEGNQVGDLVLDFDAGCISGCNSGPLSAQNLSNGANSENNVLVNNLSEDATFQTNIADIDSSLILSSDTGNNTSSYNTNGDSVIQTGDANTSGNILTFANNNIAGKIIFGVVNIFGDLVGDIILPEDFLACPECQGGTTAVNANNGTDSQNNVAVTTSDTESTFQTNLADIENNFIVASTTGDNKTSYNTNGDSSIDTGDAEAVVQAINIANSNIEGDNMWLVIVNKAGEWVGQILGAPEGSVFAGSSGTEFSVNPNGEITATNSGNELSPQSKDWGIELFSNENGAGSENNTAISQENNSTTVQENIAKIVNNLFLSSNTGGNEASYNTGGDSTISTGDAKAIANLVNFVNNNISGNGRLVVTIVNVFGSWAGDFVTPGNKKENNTDNQTQALENSQSSSGGPQITSPNNQSSNQTQSLNSNPSNTPNPSNFSAPDSPNSSPLQSIFAYNSPQSNSDKEENIALVAGEKIMNTPAQVLTEGAKEVKKKVAINLAWLLLLLPVFPLFYLLKRK